MRRRRDAVRLPACGAHPGARACRVRDADRRDRPDVCEHCPRGGGDDGERAGSLTFARLATDVPTVVVDVPVVITALVLGTARVTVRKDATVGSVSAGSGVLPLIAEAARLDVRLEAASGTVLGQRGARSRSRRGLASASSSAGTTRR